jgi:rhamnosyltransferase
MGAEVMSEFLVGAVVVLFHPDFGQLRQLHDCLLSQVDILWFVDNTPGSGGDEFLPQPGQPAWNVRYRGLGENVGIAAAQNLGIREAVACGCDHVLLLDQDSLLPIDTVRKLLEAERILLDGKVKVAAVGPLFVDHKTGLPGKSHHHRWFRLHKRFVDQKAQVPEETDWLIASGSLVRSCVFTQVGPMREELFIDAVDMEWGLRARSLGFKSFIVPSAQISHSVGDSFFRLMGVSVILHSDVRNYYISRNWVYLLRLRSMGARWRSGALLHLAKFILVHAWIARRRGIRAMIFGKGVLDGLLGTMGPYRP